MDQPDPQIQLYDISGQVTGSKPRSQIDKRHDIVRAVYVLVTDGSMFLVQTVGSENLYSGRIGCSAAAIVRQGETPVIAAQRALMDDAPMQQYDELIELSHSIVVFPDGVKRLAHFFLAHTEMIIHDVRPTPQTMTTKDLNQLVTSSPDRCAPTLAVLWRTYTGSS